MFHKVPPPIGTKTKFGWAQTIKKPQPSPERLGFIPASTLHSLILEDFFVKNIQAGFLTLGSSYFLRLPILSFPKDSGLLQVSSPITEAGPFPTFPLMQDHGVPFIWISLLNEKYLNE